MKNEQVLMTKAGMSRLHARLADAHGAYHRVCEDNEVAATSGETSVWHDSFDYEENQRQMHMLGREVHRLRDLAERAQVVAPDPQPKRADVGCVVTIDLAGQTQQWLLAGWDDGDPKIGRLAYNSPLGMALWGAELGEVRECRVAGQVKEVEIVAIAPAVVEAT